MESVTIIFSMFTLVTVEILSYGRRYALIIAKICVVHCFAHQGNQKSNGKVLQQLMVPLCRVVLISSRTYWHVTSFEMCHLWPSLAFAPPGFGPTFMEKIVPFHVSCYSSPHGVHAWYNL